MALAPEVGIFMSHFYDRITGQLYDVVPNKSKPGEYRDFTLRDARPLNALPSVTTVLNLLGKPGLVRWQVEQGIKAAFTMAPQYSSSMEETEQLVIVAFKKSEEYVHWTADFGTAVHWWVHAKLTRGILASDGVSTEFWDGRTGSMAPIIPHAEEAADYLVEWLPANGFEITETEHHFVNAQLGWGGTVDFLGKHYGKPFIGDLKTQSEPLTFYDPEHPLQKAGYSLGLGLDPDIERITFILNRDEFAVKQKLWTENARYDEAFMGLAQLWMLLNKYDPREVE